jgi:Trp operon repressor
MVRIKKWEQILEICSKRQDKEKDEKILLTILTISDFGGYCSKSDNLNMTLHVLPKNISNFYNYLLTQSISA